MQYEGLWECDRSANAIISKPNKVFFFRRHVLSDKSVYLSGNGPSTETETSEIFRAAALHFFKESSENEDFDVTSDVSADQYVHSEDVLDDRDAVFASEMINLMYLPEEQQRFKPFIRQVCHSMKASQSV